jgi:hypothetical protein
MRVSVVYAGHAVASLVGHGGGPGLHASRMWGNVVDKVAEGPGFSECFGFPHTFVFLQCSRLLHLSFVNAV